jgi:hypothetical protein
MKTNFPFDKRSRIKINFKYVSGTKMEVYDQRRSFSLNKTLNFQISQRNRAKFERGPNHSLAFSVIRIVAIFRSMRHMIWAISI